MVLKLVNDCIYFEIVFKSLSYVFKKLDIPHEIVQEIDYSESRDVYIICTTHHVNMRLPQQYIAYNFEQLITDKVWPQEFYSRLSGAMQVWDYSIENIKVLRSHGLMNVVHVPFGYTPIMDCVDTVKQWKDRALNWMFLGSVGEHRAEKLDHIVKEYHQRSHECLITNNCWGSKLSELYYNTKIGLNIHYYPGQTILEVHRIIPMIANRVWVVSEQSHDPFYDDAFKKMLTFIPKTNDNQKVSRIIKDTVNTINSLPEEWINKDLENKRDFLINNFSYVDFFRQSLGALVIRSLQVRK